MIANGVYSAENMKLYVFQVYLRKIVNIIKVSSFMLFVGLLRTSSTGFCCAQQKLTLLVFEAQQKPVLLVLRAKQKTARIVLTAQQTA